MQYRSSGKILTLFEPQFPVFDFLCCHLNMEMREKRRSSNLDFSPYNVPQIQSVEGEISGNMIAFLSGNTQSIVETFFPISFWQDFATL